MRFSGKRAVVTGGASGIGRATALRLAEEGAQVWVGDIDEEGGTALAETSKGRVHFQRCDVTKAGDIEALVAAADAAGGLDVLFNNAGAGGSRARIDEIAPDDWDATQALLLRSVALGIRYAAPLMAKNGGGAIVNTSSVSALGSGYAPLAYSVAKAGVLHLTKMAAAELARHKIRVNAVVPGFIATNIFTSSLGLEGDKRDAANAAVDRSLQHNYIGRKEKKRNFRALWIQRINAAVREHGLTYSRFIAGLAKAQIDIDRKVLSDLAIHEPAAFKALVDQASKGEVG